MRAELMLVCHVDKAVVQTLPWKDLERLPAILVHGVRILACIRAVTVRGACPRDTVDFSIRTSS
jgi:hypothetical protein